MYAARADHRANATSKNEVDSFTVVQHLDVCPHPKNHLKAVSLQYQIALVTLQMTDGVQKQALSRRNAAERDVQRNAQRRDDGGGGILRDPKFTSTC